MISPRTVEFPPVIVRAVPLGTLVRSSSIFGAAAGAPGCVVPSMVTGSVIGGSDASVPSSVIVCRPPAPMLKWIASGPGLAFAAAIASRRVQSAALHVPSS